ncbi:MAG: hypothetical protein Q7V19_03710 [Bacteroidales bacterium]|nr:hypothetical protein [Bacteroidales bacterium]
MKKYLPSISFFVLVTFLNMLISCSYYSVKKVPSHSIDQKLLNEYKIQQKYLILHQGDNVWHMENIVLDENNQKLYFTPTGVTKDHLFYKNTKETGANRYKANNENPVIEVHIYISEYALVDQNQFMIPMEAIQKIEVYDRDIGATTASYVFGALGVITGAFAIVMILVALLKSSCPFVYIHDGVAWHFVGETYGGAIYQPLERDDYMPLTGFKPIDNHYKLKISNELLERQYTDLARLIVVEHPLNSKVILDQNGAVQTLISAVMPTKALAQNNFDYVDQLTETDGNFYIFNTEDKENDDFSSLDMSFEKLLNASSAKLVLHAKNSLWLDYIFGRFNELFGTYYPKFAQNQHKAPAERMLKWQHDQGIPLSVFVETDNGWEKAGSFFSVGPLASRDLVMPLDLSNVKTENVNIRLQCGFMFWEIDYAALDFSDTVDVQISQLSPTSATDEKGNDVTDLLTTTDRNYLYQPDVGNEVVITYAAPAPNEGRAQTVFLHSRGYYEYIRDYKNKPDLSYLKSFRKEGAFTRFSKNHYNKLVTDKQFIVKALSN